MSGRLPNRLTTFEREQLRYASIVAGWEQATSRQIAMLERSMARAYRAIGRSWRRGKSEPKPGPSRMQCERKAVLGKLQETVT